MRVLVASEDEAERRVIREALATRRDVHEVLYAVDGVETYIAVRKSSFDVVVISAALPRVDGIVIVRTLLRTPLARDARTLLVLSRDCSGRVREALEARPTGILVRPFGPETFLDRFGTILTSEISYKAAARIRVPVA